MNSLDGSDFGDKIAFDGESDFSTIGFDSYGGGGFESDCSFDAGSGMVALPTDMHV